jgi:hypothetical protein
MHWTREIDPLHRVAIVTVSGELTGDGLFMLYDELRDAPEVGSDFALLVDLRRASGRKLTSDGIGALAQRPLKFSPKARRAVVVSSDFELAMAQLYNMFRSAEGGELAIARDFAVTRRWVEIQEE